MKNIVFFLVRACVGPLFCFDLLHGPSRTPVPTIYIEHAGDDGCLFLTDASHPTPHPLHSVQHLLLEEKAFVAGLLAFPLGGSLLLPHSLPPRWGEAVFGRVRTAGKRLEDLRCERITLG